MVRNYFVRTALLLTVALWIPFAPAQETQTPAKSGLTPETELVKQLEDATSKGGYPQALAMLEERLKAEPRNLPARFFLATAYQAKENYAACIQTARDGEKQGDADDRLLGILWVCLNDSGQKEEAMTVALDAVERFPRSGESHRWLGISYLQAGNRTLASAHLQHAFRVDPQDGTALYLLAQIFRQQVEIVPSVLTYLRFLSLEPVGNRATKARAQLEAVLKPQLSLSFTGPNQMEAHLSLGEGAQEQPSEEGTFTHAQQVLTTYTAPTNQAPKLTPEKLAKALAEVLKALPGDTPGEGSFTRQCLLPFLTQTRETGRIQLLAELALTEGQEQFSPEAVAYLQWAATLPCSR